MKKLILIIIICFLGTQYTEAQNKDTLKTIHIGVIPYQFLSRSCGVYINKTTLHGKFSFEYRPTYTIATNFLTQLDYPTYEWFYYQGINNTLLLSFKIGGTWKFGLLLGYKIWWYKHKRIPWENRPLSSDYSYKQDRSGIMIGPVGGVEFQKDIRGKKRDAAFYMNFSVTKFTGKTTIYASTSYPYPFNELVTTHEDNSTIHFNVAIGFKFDLTKRN